LNKLDCFREIEGASLFLGSLYNLAWDDGIRFDLLSGGIE